MEVMVVGEAKPADDHGPTRELFRQGIVSKELTEVEHASLNLKRPLGVDLRIRQHLAVHGSDADARIGMNGTLGKIDVAGEEVVEALEI